MTRSTLDRQIKVLYTVIESGPITAQGIADNMGVSVRTVYRDLTAIRDEWEMPVWFSRQDNSWRADGAGCRTAVLQMFGLEKYA